MARILVIGDDHDILWTLATYLRSTGHSVWVLKSGTEVVDWLRATTVDLIIIDDRISGLSASEIIDSIKSHPTHIRPRCVLMSALPDLSNQANSDAFLEKPVQVEELDATLARLLQNEP